MRSRMIFFCIGIACASLQPVLIPAYLCISVALAMMGLSLRLQNRSISLLALFAVGFSYSTLSAHSVLNKQLPDEQVRSDWYLSGVISELPQNTDGFVRFNLVVEHAKSLEKNALQSDIRKVRLSWYQPELVLRSGMRIELEARLKPPHGLVNPEGFDYEKWLFSHGIHATGYVRKVIKVEDVTSGQTNAYISARIAAHISALREYINHFISANVAKPEHEALIKALVTGDKQSLSQEQWEQLRRSGTVHLAVISGLHIGFMAFVGWWFGRGVALLASEQGMRIWPYFFSLVFAGAYALIAGAELPVQRAFIMLSVLMLSGAFLHVADWWTRWLLALTVVLLIHPHAVLETGLWLSFAAVAALIWLSQRQWSWRQAFKLQLMLSLAMLPLYLFFFSGLSLTAPFINLIAIPLISLLVVFVFAHLILLAVEIDWLGWPVTQLIDLFWWLVSEGSRVDWAFFELNGVSHIGLGFAALAVLLLLLPPTFCPRLIALMMFLPVLVGTGKPETDGFSAWVYDVGQGLAVLVKVGDYHLLYDTAAAYRSGSSAAEWALLPHLKHKGVKQIDRLILSHDDIDHAGGYNAIKKEIDVTETIASFPGDQNHTICEAGQSWIHNGVRFEMLAGGEGETDNDRSCVLKISYKECSLLLPGDISAEGEAKLPISQPVTWLVAAHHGSKHSTSVEFIKKLQPQAVIFSAGYANHYHHPHPDVIKRVQQNSDAEIFSTAEDGAIKLGIIGENVCSAKAFRDEQKRFWR